MDADQKRHHRREMLKKSSAWVASLTALPLMASSAGTRAENVVKAGKATLRYQDRPKNGKICADCWAYVAGRNAAEGTCKAIEGPISANGWCMAFSPKRRRTKT
ncbi:MAG: high-potential iron-sulfur protein [Betaproteobacteria bacterium]|nr:high-potential iron-sulfur protein [Betaproteobacteria bacterium]